VKKIVIRGKAQCAAITKQKSFGTVRGHSPKSVGADGPEGLRDICACVKVQFFFRK